MATRLHSKGEWTATRDVVSGWNIACRGEDSTFRVAEVVKEIDAHLIAAAPDLLRAAVLAEGLLKFSDPNSNARKALVEAIAHARGVTVRS